jgi:hypothetical protein
MSEIKSPALRAARRSPLAVKNQKGKDLKYQVLTREGFTAKHEVE